MASVTEDVQSTAEKVRARYLEAGRATGTKTSGAEDEAKRLAEVLKAHLRSAAFALLECAQQQPVSYSYQADATSHRLQTRVSTASSSGQRVTRGGKELLELLQERGYYKSISPSGRMRDAIVVRDPLPLSAGKKVWNEFTAYANFMPMLQRIHKGPNLTHVHADRAVFAA